MSAPREAEEHTREQQKNPNRKTDSRGIYIKLQSGQHERQMRHAIGIVNAKHASKASKQGKQARRQASVLMLMLRKRTRRKIEASRPPWPGESSRLSLLVQPCQPIRSDPMAVCTESNQIE